MWLSTFDMNTAGLIALALINCITAVLTWRTNRNVVVVERATNSMKDALVSATGLAAHAAGREEGRVEGAERAAAVAEGVLRGKDLP